MQKFTRIFRKLPDPRADNARHDLTEILVIALAAVLCGAESCADMADFGEAKEGVLRRFLRLGDGVPSHDTFRPGSAFSIPLPSQRPSASSWRPFAKRSPGGVWSAGK